MTLENEQENILKGKVVGFDTSKLKAIGVKESTVVEGGDLTKTTGFVVEEKVSAVEALEELDLEKFEPSKPADPIPAAIPDVITANPVDIAPVDPLSSLLVETPEEEKKEESTQDIVPDLQIQLPVMEEEVLAVEPQGINEGLFGDNKVETKFEPTSEEQKMPEPIPEAPKTEEIKTEAEVLNTIPAPVIPSNQDEGPKQTNNEEITKNINAMFEEFEKNIKEATDKFRTQVNDYIKKMSLLEEKTETKAVETPQVPNNDVSELPSLDAFVDPMSLINGIQEGGPRL